MTAHSHGAQRALLSPDGRPVLPATQVNSSGQQKHPRTAVAAYRSNAAVFRVFEMAAPVCGAPGAPAGTGGASAASLYIPMPCRQRHRPYISVSMTQGCWTVLYVAQPPSKLCDCVKASR